VLTIPAAIKLWYCPDPVDMRLGFHPGNPCRWNSVFRE
jgi:hypothetical protein